MSKHNFKKIAFVIPYIIGGGAEKSLLTLLDNLDRSKFEPLLIYFTQIPGDRNYMANDVKQICLKKISRYSAPRLIFSLAKVMEREKPSLMVPFMPYASFLTLLARRLAGLHMPVIISQRNNLTVELQHENFPFLKTKLARRLFPQAELIHCISQGIKTDLTDNFGLPPEKIVVIYNPFNLREIDVLKQQEVEHPWFSEAVPVLLACGRLTAQKNYPLLFRAMRQVLEKMQIRLIILGEGEERRNLEVLASRLGLMSHVAFLGFQPNPFRFMSRAKALILSSAWEGFPRVIVEAMACGLPVISTRCPYGPEEIITHGVNGYLVPAGQETPLAEAILQVLNDEALRSRLAQGGLRRALDFSTDKVVPQFEELFLRFAL